MLPRKLFLDPLPSEALQKPRLPEKGHTIVYLTFVYRNASQQSTLFHNRDIDGPLSKKLLRQRFGLQCIDHLSVEMLYDRLSRTATVTMAFGDEPPPRYLCKRYLTHRYCNANTCYKVHLNPRRQWASVAASEMGSAEGVEEEEGDDEKEAEEPEPEGNEVEGEEEDLEVGSQADGSSDRSRGEDEVAFQRDGKKELGMTESHSYDSESYEDEEAEEDEIEGSGQDESDDSTSHSAPKRARLAATSAISLSQPKTAGIASFWAQGGAPPPGGWKGRGRTGPKGKGKGKEKPLFQDKNNGSPSHSAPKRARLAATSAVSLSQPKTAGIASFWAQGGAPPPGGWKGRGRTGPKGKGKGMDAGKSS